MASLALSGEKLERLSTALRDAFTVQRLREMLRFKLDKRLDDYSLGGDYKEIAFELIVAAEAEGWTAELLVAARQSNPGSAALQAMAQDLDLASSTPALERTIKEKNPYLDVEIFRTKLGEIEGRVCRIEIPTPRGTVYGTGFLVGPDVLMTNYHVMDGVIAGQVPPASVVCRFDYRRLPSSVVAEGTTFALAADWLIDSSPTSAVDLAPEPKTGTPRADELDYALVRLAGSPGNGSVGAKADPNAPKRGWIAVAAGAVAAPGSPILIVQHPDSAPLKLALDMNGVRNVNANGTRMTYTVNTEGGSSGAPCFNVDWELVALHHAGDPNFAADHAPQYNEGIPIAAIVSLLTERGKHGHLA